MSFRTLIESMPDAPFNPDGGADRFLNDFEAAKSYCLSRRVDANALLNQGLGRLRYVRVCSNASAEKPNEMLVDDQACSHLICAAAYILAKFW